MMRFDKWMIAVAGSEIKAGRLCAALANHPVFKHLPAPQFVPHAKKSSYTMLISTNTPPGRSGLSVSERDKPTETWVRYRRG